MKAWLSATPALALLAAAGLPGCSAGRCLAPPDWPKNVDFGLRLPDMDVEFERFSVDAAGTVLWSGFPSRPTPVSRAEFRKILATVSDAPEGRWLVLDAPAGADCEAVRAVRAEMDQLPLCLRGHCVEGKVWDRSDPPRGL